MLAVDSHEELADAHAGKVGEASGAHLGHLDPQRRRRATCGEPEADRAAAPPKGERPLRQMRLDAPRDEGVPRLARGVERLERGAQAECRRVPTECRGGATRHLRAELP